MMKVGPKPILDAIRLASTLEEMRGILTNALGQEATTLLLASGEVSGEGSAC